MAIMQIKIPCCDSIRSCKQTAIYIHDTTNNEIVNKIEAIRCYKLGYTPEISIEFDPHKHIVYYLYISNRGNAQITIYHIPPNINQKKAREIIFKTHGLTR
jgi:6-phosphogluconolactonase (cycloisomerase 2 family)